MTVSVLLSSSKTPLSESVLSGRVYQPRVMNSQTPLPESITSDQADPVESDDDDELLLMASQMYEQSANDDGEHISSQAFFSEPESGGHDGVDQRSDPVKSDDDELLLAASQMYEQSANDEDKFIEQYLKDSEQYEGMDESDFSLDYLIAGVAQTTSSCIIDIGVQKKDLQSLSVKVRCWKKLRMPFLNLLSNRLHGQQTFGKTGLRIDKRVVRKSLLV